MHTAAYSKLPPDAIHTQEDKPAHAFLYHRLLEPEPANEVKQGAVALLDHYLEQQNFLKCDLPDDPQHLHVWMRDGANATTSDFSEYLRQRRVGAGRRYFSNRAHALYF